MQTPRANNQSRAVIERITYRSLVYIACRMSRSSHSVWPGTNFPLFLPNIWHSSQFFPVSEGLRARAPVCVIYLCYYEPGMAHLKEFIRFSTRIYRSVPVHFLVQSLFLPSAAFIVLKTCPVNRDVPRIHRSINC